MTRTGGEAREAGWPDRCRLSQDVPFSPRRPEGGLPREVAQLGQDSGPPHEVAQLGQDSGPPHEVAQLGQDSAALSKTRTGPIGAALSKTVETRFLITEDALALEDALAFLRRPAWGAQSFFTGSVRTPNKGKEVEYLEYEAYGPMCRRILENLALEAADKTRIAPAGGVLSKTRIAPAGGVLSETHLGGVYVAHRTGRLYPAELSIIVGVGSPHRRAALEACDYLVERIKAVLPVWKLERNADGEEWVEGNTESEPL